MKIAASLVARLEFLSRVTEKECKHLLDTDRRLFGNLFTLEDAQKIEADPIRFALHEPSVIANVVWQSMNSLFSTMDRHAGRHCEERMRRGNRDDDRRLKVRLQFRAGAGSSQ